MGCRVSTSRTTGISRRALSVAYDLKGKGTTVIRSGGGLFYDVFSQDFFLGQVPYNADTPGSAYNDIGPKPILSSSTVASQIAPDSPFSPTSAPRRTCSPWTSTFPHLTCTTTI